MKKHKEELNDPIVDEVRAAREAFARKFNFDLDAIGRYFRKRQKESEKEGLHYSIRYPKSLEKKHGL